MTCLPPPLRWPLAFSTHKKKNVLLLYNSQSLQTDTLELAMLTCQCLRIMFTILVWLVSICKLALKYKSRAGDLRRKEMNQIEHFWTEKAVTPGRHKSNPANCQPYQCQAKGHSFGVRLMVLAVLKSTGSRMWFLLDLTSDSIHVIIMSWCPLNYLPVHLDRSLVLLVQNNCWGGIAKMASEWRDIA